MSAISLPLTAGLDAALDEVQREQACVRRLSPSAARSHQMADLCAREARLWQVLFERTRSRVHWRAALAAELYARERARRWRRAATAQADAVLGVAQAATADKPSPNGHVVGGVS